MKLGGTLSHGRFRKDPWSAMVRWYERLPGSCVCWKHAGSMQALIRSELSWKMVLPQSRKLIKLGAEQLLSMHLKKFDHLNWNEVTSLWYPSFSGNFRTLKWKCCTFSIHYVVPPMAVPETMQPKLAKPDLHGNRSIGHSTSQPHLFSLGKKKRINRG